MGRMAMPVAAMSLIDQLGDFPCTVAPVASGAVAYRQASSGGYSGPVTHVLLHGIGSGSGSWLAQLAQARLARDRACHVVAWDAPGYGQSAPLLAAAPLAEDYAQRLWDWLDAAQFDTSAPLTLVGHSLGALMVASAARLRPARVRQVLLLAPAQGYANASAAVREKKLVDRLANLTRLGPAGLAKDRAVAMLSAQAGAHQIAFVEQIMAGIHARGYTQAAHMLAGGVIAADLAQLRCPVTVASGSADSITPQAGCRALAAQIGARYVSLGDAGHSCALEAAAAVGTLLGIDGAVA